MLEFCWGLWLLYNHMKLKVQNKKTTIILVVISLRNIYIHLTYFIYFDVQENKLELTPGFIYFKDPVSIIIINIIIIIILRQSREYLAQWIFFCLMHLIGQLYFMAHSITFLLHLTTSFYFDFSGIKNNLSGSADITLCFY